MSHDDDDYEESLISQFETTLSIRPSNNDEDEDLSIDHTVYSNYTGADHSVINIQELEDEEVLLEQIAKFKTKTNRRLSLLPKEATKKQLHTSDSSRGGSRRSSPAPQPSPYEEILAPSPLIDYSLAKYQKCFQLFLSTNPHISKESPKFTREQDKTLVILSPYSAEHAFGRKWVTKSYLSTIFERPQRLLAACIGVALAITMFPFFYKLENSTKRGSILSSHVRKVHGKNWPKKLYELCLESHEKLEADLLEVPEDWNTGDIYLNPKTINAIEGVIGTLEAAVDALYGHPEKDFKEPKKLPKSPQNGINGATTTSATGVNTTSSTSTSSSTTTSSSSSSTSRSGSRSRSSSSGSDSGSNLAFVVIRPPGHHSHACLPSGFCLLNNVQIAAEYSFEKYGVTHVAILDIDLHHGDGSQDICWERAGFTGDYGKEEEDEFDEEMLKNNPRNDYGKRFAMYPKVGYFSLHDIKSYPTELGFATKENIKNASTCIMDHDLNIWNVHLQEWLTEEEFYKHYQTKYVAILNRANQFLNQSKKQYEQDFQTYLMQVANYNKYLLKPHLFNAAVSKPTVPQPFKPLIMISAGFDALEYENPQMQRHGINVPTSFYSTFTKDVVKLAKIHTNGKVISVLEGGYSDGALTTGVFSHLIGLTNDEESDNLWNETWGTEQVMKELTKGCKKNWTAYKKPQSDVTIWANEVIKLGRSMMPNCILPANYMYKYVSPVQEKVAGPSSIVKELQKDNQRYETLGGGLNYLEDDRRRLTRSQYRKKDF